MLIELFSKGGVVLALLGILSLILIAVVMERFVFFRNATKKTHNFLKGFFDLFDIYQLETTELYCKENPCPISSIASKVLKSHCKTHQDFNDTIAKAGSQEIPKIESNLNILSTISYISPLLGLLGTVLGLIASFQSYDESVQSGGLPGPGVLASGIWEALITTVAGLSLGILSYIIHNYFFIKKERFITTLEECSDELFQIFIEKYQLKN